LKPRSQNPGFVRLEPLGGGRCRYVAGWRLGVGLVAGEAFAESLAPPTKLALLRKVCRQLDAIPKPAGQEGQG
jgi:hypothetical protein